MYSAQIVIVFVQYKTIQALNNLELAKGFHHFKIH